MGNRAHIVFPDAQVAIYLHWNGGLESVVSFLDYLNEIGCADSQYGPARLCQIIGNFFGGTYSLGLTGAPDLERETLDTLDHGDNGVWIVGLHEGKWQVQRHYFSKYLTNDGKVNVLEEVTPERIEQARRHEYNRGGAMLAKIRDANQPHKAEV